MSPEVGDNYLNDQVVLPLGETVSHGCLIHRKINAYNNPIDRGNSNPIPDTITYQVQFSGV